MCGVYSITSVPIGLYGRVALQEDLRLCAASNLFGARKSGEAGFKFADLGVHGDLRGHARDREMANARPATILNP